MRLAVALLAALALSTPALAQGVEGDDDAIGTILMSGANHPGAALGASQPELEPPVITPPSPPPAPAPPPEEATGASRAASAATALSTPPSHPAAPAWVPPPSPSASLAARPSQPSSLYNPGPPPDGSLSPRDLAYEGRVRTTFSSAQGAQGTLDGGWVLVSDRSERLYAFQIVDRGDGLGLEGAWRDLRRPRGALGAVGLIESIGLDAGGLSIRFTPRPGAEPVSVTLLPTPDGGWAGDVSGLEHGRVTLRRP